MNRSASRRANPFCIFGRDYVGGVKLFNIDPLFDLPALTRRENRPLFLSVLLPDPSRRILLSPECR